MPYFTITAPTRGLGCASAMPSRASRVASDSQKLFSRSGLIEERVGISLRVEGDEIVHLLAGADEADGEIELARDGHDDAAFGRAVELGEHDAGDARVAPEFARLIQAV